MKREPVRPLHYPLLVYVILWLVSTYVWFSLFSFKAEASHNVLLSGMYFIDFGVHEASHVLFALFSPVITAAAGSLGEMTFTILLLIATLSGKAYFAAVFAAQWVMLGFMSAGRYMADARSQQLPLVGFGDAVKHDWHFVFSQLGLLNADILIGGAVQGIGIGIGVLGLLYGLYLMVLKLRGRPLTRRRIPLLSIVN